MNRMTLQNLQTSSGTFTIAPFDQRGSLAKMLGVDMQTHEGKRTMEQVKSLFMKAFSPLCSAVLVDPEFGQPSLIYKSPHAGLLLTYEKSSVELEDKEALPAFYEDWPPAKIAQAGAAVKVLVYYHPESKTAAEKEKLMQEIFEQCKKLHTPFLLEVVIHDMKNASLSSFEAQIEAVKKFHGCCDVLKLEFPINADDEIDEKLAIERCKEITTTSSVPWILLSRGMGYERFLLALELAMKGGAKGFAVGRAIWKEIGSFATWNEQQEFVQTVAVERLKKLIQIVR
jgi:tagatose-1,6-bisphosphate aldolase